MWFILCIIALQVLPHNYRPTFVLFKDLVTLIQRRSPSSHLVSPLLAQEEETEDSQSAEQGSSLIRPLQDPQGLQAALQEDTDMLMLDVQALMAVKHLCPLEPKDSTNRELTPT